MWRILLDLLTSLFDKAKKTQDTLDDQAAKNAVEEKKVETVIAGEVEQGGISDINKQLGFK